MTPVPSSILVLPQSSGLSCALLSAFAWLMPAAFYAGPPTETTKPIAWQNFRALKLSSPLASQCHRRR